MLRNGMWIRAGFHRADKATRDMPRGPGQVRPLTLTLLAAVWLWGFGCGPDEEGPPSGVVRPVATATPREREPVPSAESSPVEPGEVIFPEAEANLAFLTGPLGSVQRLLAGKQTPNLVKSFDLGPPIEYDADYSWHSLKKERQCTLPRYGALGVINPNTELNYLVGFQVDAEEVRYDPPSTTILHGVDYLAERCDLGAGLTATVTFLPYDSATLFAFVEVQNGSPRKRKVRVHQLVEKEVFQYRERRVNRSGRLEGADSRRMSGVWVATRGMKRDQKLPDGLALVFSEWEQGPIGEAGELLVFVGADRRANNAWTEKPPNTKPAPKANEVLEPSVFQRGVRTYDISLAPGGKEDLACFLVLRRYSTQQLVGPRGVRPYQFGDESAALAYCRGRAEAGLRVNWKESLAERIRAYGHYPVPSLPIESWERAFLACLELPRAETVSPFGTMPIAYYNFCRAYGNELRQWWSYGEHGHESLSTFVTSLTDPGLAQTHLRGHIINQDPEGGFPYGVNQQSQPGIRTFAASAVTCPFIAWEAWNAYLWGGDKAFLGEAFDACRKSYDWWLRTRDRTGEGLCCWLDFGETVRDDGTVPTWRYEGAPVFFQEALDLNCYLLNMERVLGEMAAELGEGEAAREYRLAWRERVRTMNAYMWEPKDGCYYGISEISDVYVRVKDVSTLMPLWCGLAPLDRAQRVVEIYRDPAHFATEWPVPVLSASNPTYLSDGHWHGGNWVEMSWLVILGLKDYGYYREAARLAEKNVSMVFGELERVSHLREYFDSATGQGLSLFDYIWTSIPGIMIVDVFLGVRPTSAGLEILPALPETWKEAGIDDLYLRGRPLRLSVKRNPSVAATTVTVNDASSPVLANRGVSIPWERWEALMEGGASVEIVQPLEIAEQPAPRYRLPEDILEPLPAHARVEPTTEELSFRSPFLHYYVNPVKYLKPPTRE